MKSRRLRERLLDVAFAIFILWCFIVIVQMFSHTPIEKKKPTKTKMIIKAEGDRWA